MDLNRPIDLSGAGHDRALVSKRVFMNISPRLEIEARGIPIACYLFHSLGNKGGHLPTRAPKIRFDTSYRIYGFARNCLRATRARFEIGEFHVATEVLVRFNAKCT